MKAFKISLIAAAFALGACSQKEVMEDQPANTSTPASAPAVELTAASGFESRMQDILAMGHRSAENRARDQYRHPAETLAFFGLKESDTVIEISPGSGWYSDILAPALRERGLYLAAINDPAKAGNERAAAYYTQQNGELESKFKAHASVFDKAILLPIDAKVPMLGKAASADMVLTFRNVHNWVGASTDAAMFKAFFEVLKPGGTLGVSEHRATPGTASETNADSGYMTEDAVIKRALAAGFVLEAKSEINANPRDTKDHPEGVWTLPPTLALGEKDRAKYVAIGESDRMTLRFRKPN
jgi:predicted methyltransferase